LNKQLVALFGFIQLHLLLRQLLSQLQRPRHCTVNNACAEQQPTHLRRSIHRTLQLLVLLHKIGR
jgi:hypothetical protein